MKKLVFVLMSVWLLFALGPLAQAGHGRCTDGVIGFGIGIATAPFGYGGGYYAPDYRPRYYPPNHYRSGYGYPAPSYYPPRVVVIPREPVYSYPNDYGYYDNSQWGPPVLEVVLNDLVLGYNGFYYSQRSCYLQGGYYRPYVRYQNDYWYQENRQWRHHFQWRNHRRYDHRDYRDYSGQYDQHDRHWGDREKDYHRRSDQRQENRRSDRRDVRRGDDGRRSETRSEMIRPEFNRRPKASQPSRKASEARTAPSVPADRPPSQRVGRHQTRSGISSSLEPARRPHNSRRSTEVNRPTTRSHH